MAAPLQQAEPKHFERAWGESARWKSTLILIHPIGVLLYVLMTLVCALIAERGLPPARQLVPLLVAMFCSQSVVGIANEVADRNLDARTKPWRPLPSGHVSPRAATSLGLLFTILSVAAASKLSIPAAALLFCGTATGVVYDIWLKRTPLSWLPYVVTYPGFPLWVWLALGHLGDPATLQSGPAAWLASVQGDPRLPRLLAVYPVLIPLALAAHLCNQLRDFDEDLAAGTRGVVHYLGKPAALRACFALLALGPLPMLATASRGPQLLVVLAAAVFHWIVTAIGMRRYQAGGAANDLRRLFRLLQLSGPLLALTWLAGALG
ncbi:MAG TPA: UbiA family prenyltransferase [Anaerolineae bacterium]